MILLRLFSFGLGLLMLVLTGMLMLVRRPAAQSALMVSYQCHHETYHYEIYSLERMTVDGDRLPPLDLPVAQIANLIWVDPAWIVFTAQTGNQFDLYRVQPNGDHLQNLTADQGGDDIMPALSPAGDWLIYANNRMGYVFDLYRMQVDGSQRERITALPSHELYPQWSPDGATVAFVYLENSENPEIYRMATDGSTYQNLTNHPAHDSSPIWSPDGAWIIFFSDRAEPHRVYRMRPDGSEVEPILSDLMDAKNFQWSPDAAADGGWLLFEGKVNSNNWDIFKMRGDGSDLQNLTQFSGTDNFPVWSPDGRWIFFSSFREGRYDIFRMNADGSDLRKLPAGRCLSADRPVVSPPLHRDWRGWLNALIGFGLMVIAMQPLAILRYASSSRSASSSQS